MKRRAGFATWNWSVATTFLLVQTESLVAVQQPARQSHHRGRRGELPLFSSADRNSLHEDDRLSTRIIETDSNGSEMVSKGSNGVREAAPISSWPSFDALDKKISIIALPCIANFAINPLVGAIDLFWVNQMKSALAVAGQVSIASSRDDLVGKTGQTQVTP